MNTRAAYNGLYMLVKSSNRPRAFLRIFWKAVSTISILFCTTELASISVNVTRKRLSSIQYTYPQFKNSQESAFNLDDEVIFVTLANSDESNADEVLISAL